MPLHSYILAHDEPTPTNTAYVHALDCCFLHAIHMKQGGYECYHIPTHQVITQPYITVIPTTPTIIVTINALSKSGGIQNLKITDLHRHLLFDSMDPALLAGVDGNDDNNNSLAGVPIPITTNDDDDDLDTESNHNSIDPKRQITIQAKHPFTALEAMHQFTT